MRKFIGSFAVLLVLQRPVFGQRYLTSLYENNLKEFMKQTAGKTVAYNDLLSLYAENASSLSLETFKFLFNQGADLSGLVKDAYAPKTIFQAKEALPSAALIAVLKSGQTDIIAFLSDKAEESGIARNFYFGSYSNKQLGSNGLLGAALSGRVKTEAGYVSALWKRAEKYGKAKDLIVYRWEDAVALFDDVAAVKTALANGIRPSAFWQLSIDYEAKKIVEFLCSADSTRIFVADGQIISALSYAYLTKKHDLEAIISSTSSAN